MKKYIISIFLIVICYFGYGQTQFPVKQGIGSPTSLVKTPDYGGIQGGLIPYTFADTSAANAALLYLKNYCGAVIYCTTQQALFYRSCYNGYKWEMIEPSGSPSYGNFWRIGLTNGLFTSPTSPQQIGTGTNQGFQIATNSIARATIDSNGINRTSDPVYKYVMIDTAGSEHYLAYGDGGGGGGTVVVRDSVSALAPILYNSSTGVFSADTSTANTGLTTLYQNGLKADKTTTMSAGFGLLGGGSLASNRTFDADSTVLATHWYVDSSIVAIPTPTWQQTLTAGSTLTGDNIANFGGYALTFEDALEFNFNTLGSGSNYAKLSSSDGLSKLSQIYVYNDSIELKPSLGHLDIDSLTNDVGVYALRWNPTTGLVSYADTTVSGGGGGGINIYNTDSTLAGNRIIDFDSHYLQFANINGGDNILIGDVGDAIISINSTTQGF